MNTKPDDTTLALWLEDELTGDALQDVEAWAAGHPDQLAAREEIRRWRSWMGTEFQSSEEPPAAEFFNARIRHAILRDRQPVAKPSRAWNRLWVPLAACAGMTITFWLGATLQAPPSATAHSSTAPTPNALHILYAPEQGVNAEWQDNKDSDATIIVLKGVDQIPDTTDFSDSTSDQTRQKEESTASAPIAP